jgi:hypothetical protein
MENFCAKGVCCFPKVLLPALSTHGGGRGSRWHHENAKHQLDSTSIMFILRVQV